MLSANIVERVLYRDSHIFKINIFPTKTEAFAAAHTCKQQKCENTLYVLVAGGLIYERDESAKLVLI